MPTPEVFLEGKRSSFAEEAVVGPDHHQNEEDVALALESAVRVEFVDDGRDEELQFGGEACSEGGLGFNGRHLL